jgi:hypothetical protein
MTVQARPSSQAAADVARAIRGAGRARVAMVVAGDRAAVRGGDLSRNMGAHHSGDRVWRLSLKTLSTDRGGGQPRVLEPERPEVLTI